MKYLNLKTLRTFLAQQSGQTQLLIIAPLLTLSLLSLVVRTASSAVDPALEKKKVTEQLKRRLSEVQNEEESKVALAVEAPPPAAPLCTTYQIKKHATLVALLNAEGIDSEEATEWLAVAGKLRELRRMRPGHTVIFSFTEDGENRALQSLSYEIDQRSLLVL